MGEALVRLRMEPFKNNGNVLPNEVRMCYEDIPMSFEFLTEGDAVTKFIEKYEEFTADIRNGKYEITRQQNCVLFIAWMYCPTSFKSTMEYKLMILTCGLTD